MAKKTRATKLITISVQPSTAELAKMAVASGQYRSVSHFFEVAAQFKGTADGLI
jgi:hypothetical protein